MSAPPVVTNSEDLPNRNRIGNISLDAYENEDHIGYDANGRRIYKTIKKSEIQALIDRVENPDFWKTITVKKS